MRGEMPSFDGSSQVESRPRLGTASLVFSTSTIASVTVTFAGQFPTGVTPVVTATAVGTDARVTVVVDQVSNVAFVIRAAFPTAISTTVPCNWAAAPPTQ